MTSEEVVSTSPARSGRIWGPMIAVWFVWGSTYLAIAIIVRHAPPLVSIGVRLIAAGLILAAVVAFARGPGTLRVTRRQLVSVAVLGLGIIGVASATAAIGLRYVPSGVAALLFAVIPLFVVILRILGRDRPATLTLVGTAIGLSGLAVILLPGGTHPVQGDDRDVVVWSLVLLGAAFSWAFFSYHSARFTLPRNSLVTACYEMVIAGGVLVVLGLARGERVTGEAFSGEAIAAWVYLTLASIIAFGAYTWLIGHAPMSLVATFAYVNPVVAVCLGWLIARESITPDVIVGVTVVVGGVALVLVGERRR